MDYQYITCTLLLLFIDNTACGFYRATLYAQAQSLLSPGVRLSVCLSVRLSVTLVHCIQMAEDIARLLSRPGSTIILFF